MIASRWHLVAHSRFVTLGSAVVAAHPVALSPSSSPRTFLCTSFITVMVCPLPPLGLFFRTTWICLAARVSFLNQRRIAWEDSQLLALCTHNCFFGYFAIHAVSR